MNFLSRFFGHLHTINSHRHKVIANCFRAGIPWRGLMHDLSKYSPTEFFNGVKYYQGMRSPNEAEREDIGYSRAWMHHKGRNRHHFEYWIERSILLGIRKNLFYAIYESEKNGKNTLTYAEIINRLSLDYVKEFVKFI